MNRAARRQVAGQSTMEYAMFIAAAAAALMGMGLYIQRSVQANLKTLEGGINRAVFPAPAPGGGGPPPEGPPEPPPPPDPMQ